MRIIEFVSTSTTICVGSFSHIEPVSAAVHIPSSMAEQFARAIASVMSAQVSDRAGI